jgi:hypothetical protein
MLTQQRPGMQGARSAVISPDAVAAVVPAQGRLAAARSN